MLLCLTSAIAGLSSLGRAPGSHQEVLTKYLLSRLLGNSEDTASPYSQRRDSDSSYKFPLVRYFKILVGGGVQGQG